MSFIFQRGVPLGPMPGTETGVEVNIVQSQGETEDEETTSYASSLANQNILRLPVPQSA